MASTFDPRRWLYQRVARLHSAQLIRTKARTRRASRYGYTFVVLETIGARSGSRRQATLLYLRNGADYILLASNFGQERPPAWYFNLLSQPDVHVLYEGTRVPVHASVVDGPERAALVPQMTGYNRQWKRYFRTVERELPVVRLTPR
jgi:deazaflavin-dependent oxidoreductase (nitroreductase family)